MYCPKCGVQIPDDAQFCPECGTTVESEAFTNEQFEETTPVIPQRTEKQRPPMLWHYFLCYFGLWLGALLSLNNAVLSISGAHYGNDAVFMYTILPSLRYADLFLGAASVLTAVYTIVTAISLIRYQKKGVKRLILLYIFILLANIIFTAWVGVILFNYGARAKELTNLIVTCAFTIITSIILLSVCSRYYSKRKYLFKNK